jgi:hypothetical protein
VSAAGPRHRNHHCSGSVSGRNNSHTPHANTDHLVRCVVRRASSASRSAGHGGARNRSRPRSTLATGSQPSRRNVSQRAPTGGPLSVAYAYESPAGAIPRRARNGEATDSAYTARPRCAAASASR